MRIKSGFLALIVAALFLVKCAPKVSKEVAKSTNQNNAAIPASDIQHEPLQGNTPQGGDPTDPVRVQELSDDEKAAYLQQVTANGKLIWSTKCKKCHELYSPGSRTRPEWTKIMEVMAERAKLDETEKIHVTAYLHSAAKP